MARKIPSSIPRIGNPNPAPVMPERPSLDWFCWELQHQHVRAKASLAEWAARLAVNPLDAFSWGEEAVNAAGLVEVHTWWLNSLCDADTVAQYPSFTAILTAMEDELLDEVVRGARSPSRSTSPLSNEAGAAKLRAQARLLETVRAERRRIAAADLWDAAHPDNKTSARPVPEAARALVTMKTDK